MKIVWLLACLASVILSGCALHDEQQIASVKAAGVSATIVGKLERESPLTPEEIVQLKRRKVNEEIIINHVDEVGVNYLVDRNALKKVKASGASEELIEVLLNASDDFRSAHERPRYVDVSYGYESWYPFYYDIPYYYGGYYGGRSHCYNGHGHYHSHGNHGHRHH